MSTDTQPRRVLFLVTTPIWEKLDWVLHKIDSELPKATANPAGQPATVWHDKTSSPSASIPTIEPHASFTKHFALGAMDEDDWEDSDLTVVQKLGKAYFWQHLGSSHCPSSSEARHVGAWKEEDIRKIAGIQFLGWTEKSNDVITDDYCSKLLKGWSYLPVWWNCQAFATRLAFLVVELETYRNLVARLAKQLHQHIVHWVISCRDKKLIEVADAAGRFGLECWVNGIFSGFFCPPAAPVCGAGAVGCLLVFFGTSLTVAAYRFIDATRSKGFQKNMKRLQGTFPLLEQLHTHICDPERGMDFSEQPYVDRVEDADDDIGDYSDDL
ncbi:hypothetical protein QBC47DRAFT_395403 [Echria macrotheca]|uniref:Uncharacterized protein n=1 Tax=Echria macrotheca TaxID=438768 RepID=A0AAJ0F3Y4_9PEZI|nr:hypothetical protein QBC47DRAFT_395403 [Echria macrotheca]